MSAAVVSVASAVPERRWAQREVYDLLAQHVPAYRRPRIEQVFMNAGIEHRHLAVDPARFDPEADADALHAAFVEHALALSLEAAERALAQAGLTPDAVDALFVATSTGYVCPGLSARLLRPLGLRTDVVRSDLVGAGCGGAVPALLRAADAVRARPGTRALVINVEICSACLYIDDTLETAVGNAICADGAAATLISSVADDPGPRLTAFASLSDPDLLAKVGFDFRAGKQRIVLHKDVRKVAGPLVRMAGLRLLEEQGLRPDAVQHWIAHTGGKRVLDGIEAAMGFDADELAVSRSVLRDYGNMSSPTVLVVLERTLAWRRPRPGDVGLLVALGPGLVAETALLRW